MSQPANVRGDKASHIDVQQAGHGSPLILLHSLLCDSRGFQHILPELQRHRRVLIPSLPGYGRSSFSEGNVQAVAGQLARCFDELALEKFDLVGNGYGGFLALSFTQLFPERVNRLVLLDSAAHFPEAGKDSVRLMKRTVETGGMSAVVPTAIKRLFPEAFTQANPTLIEQYRQALLGFDPKTFAHTCQNLIEVDLRDGLPHIQNQTLVVVGLEDGATPPPLAREVAENIPGARLVEIPGCGHAPHIQEAQRTLSLINEFCA
jgi:3-oxoadipate enol-lactonase